MTVHSTIEAGDTSPAFLPFQGWARSRLALPAEEVAENVRLNRARGLPKLHEDPAWGKWKGRPLALVAGGPSLRKTIEELAEFDGDIMACGSVHDFLVQHNVWPTHAVVCAARTSETEGPQVYLRHPVGSCKYLIASCCPASVFDALDDYDVLQWNNFFGDEYNPIFEGEPIIGGGSTVTLRAISIAFLLGYQDLHFFGLDSCFEDKDDNHAYRTGPGSLEHDIIPVRVENAHDGSQGREFLTHVAWLVQARDFQETLSVAGHLLSWTIHGDGLIAEIMRQAEIKARLQQEKTQ